MINPCKIDFTNSSEYVRKEVQEICFNANIIWPITGRAFKNENFLFIRSMLCAEGTVCGFEKSELPQVDAGTFCTLYGSEVKEKSVYSLDGLHFYEYHADRGVYAWYLLSVPYDCSTGVYKRELTLTEFRGAMKAHKYEALKNKPDVTISDSGKRMYMKMSDNTCDVYELERPGIQKTKRFLKNISEEKFINIPELTEYKQKLIDVKPDGTKVYAPVKSACKAVFDPPHPEKNYVTGTGEASPPMGGYYMPRALATEMLQKFRELYVSKKMNEHIEQQMGRALRIREVGKPPELAADYALPRGAGKSKHNASFANAEKRYHAFINGECVGHCPKTKDKIRPSDAVAINYENSLKPKANIIDAAPTNTNTDAPAIMCLNDYNFPRKL